MKPHVLTVGLVFSACGATLTPPLNTLRVEVEQNNGFVAYSSDSTVTFKVLGTLDRPLAGAPVPVRVALSPDVAASSKVIALTPSSDGELFERTDLKASGWGKFTVVADLAGLTGQSESFKVPSGKLSQTWFERVGPQKSQGCVDLVGSATSLVLETDTEPARSLQPQAGGCDGATDRKSVAFDVAASSTRWRISEADEELPALTLRPPSEPRALTLLEPTQLDGGVGSLPPPGTPFVVRFRLAGGAIPAAAAVWKATVAPQFNGTTEVLESSGTTNAQGEASLVLLAPTATQLVLRVTSGRMEQLVFINR